MRANLSALEELLNWVTTQLEFHKDEEFVPKLLEEMHSRRAAIYSVCKETEEIGNRLQYFEILIYKGTPTKRRRNRDIVQEPLPTTMVLVNHAFTSILQYGTGRGGKYFFSTSLRNPTLPS
jgi:hypothetical protein